jgi:hypothetical protein
MARIPIAEGLGTQTARINQGVSTAGGQTAALDSIARAGAVGADALNRLHWMGQDLEQAIQKQDRNIKVEESSTEAAKAIISFAGDLERDSDFSTHNTRYNAFVEEQYKIHGERFKDDPEGLKEFKQAIDAQVFRNGEAIKQRSFNGQLETNRARRDLMLPEIASMTAQTGDYEDGIARADRVIMRGVEEGTYTEAEATDRKQRFRHELNRAEVTRDIGKDPADALEKLSGDAYPSLEPEERERFRIAAQTDIAVNAEKAKKLTEQGDKELVKDTVLAFQIGMDVKPEEYQAALSSAQRLGADELEAVTTAKNAAQFVRLPKSARDSLLPQVTGVGNAEQLKAFQVAEETIEREVSKDGMQFGIEQRLVEPVQMDFSNPQALSEAIGVRLKQADYLTSHYGKPVSPLTSQEADVLVQGLKVMTPKEKTSLALALGSSTKVWEQLDKQNAGLFAMAGAIGDRQVMSAIFEGQNIIANKTTEQALSSEYLPVFDDYAGGVYAGDDKRNMINAALAHYYATRKNGIFDSGDFEKSIKAVSGGIGKVNGGKVELPRGIDQDDFEDYIDEFTPDMVKRFGGVWSMSDEQAASIIQDSAIVFVGANRYIAVRDGMKLIKPDGTEFTFSFDKTLFDKQRQRVRETSSNRAKGRANAAYK